MSGEKIPRHSAFRWFEVIPYWPGLGGFHPYAAAVIRRALLAERRRLDERLAHRTGRFENSVLFRDFMDSLPEEFRRTAWMVVDRDTREEIRRRLHLSDLDMDWQYNSIRDHWLRYDA